MPKTLVLETARETVELFRQYWKDDEKHNTEKVDNFTQAEKYFREAADSVLSFCR